MQLIAYIHIVLASIMFHKLYDYRVYNISQRAIPCRAKVSVVQVACKLDHIDGVYLHKSTMDWNRCVLARTTSGIACICIDEEM